VEIEFDGGIFSSEDAVFNRNSTSGHVHVVSDHPTLYRALSR
jgi:hypothetical protein